LLAPVVAVVAGAREGAVVVACAGPGDVGAVAERAAGVLAPAVADGGAGTGADRVLEAA
jgi:hypothetical protein